MRITKTLLKRAAREARRLALQCVTGTCPTLGEYTNPSSTSPGRPRNPNALGLIAKRIRIEREGAYVFFPYPDRVHVVHAGYATETQRERRQSLVFPLLSLADELEAQASPSYTA
jgi:hypothetical protein